MNYKKKITDKLPLQKDVDKLHTNSNVNISCGPITFNGAVDAATQNSILKMRKQNQEDITRIGMSITFKKPNISYVPMIIWFNRPNAENLKMMKFVLTIVKLSLKKRIAVNAQVLVLVNLHHFGTLTSLKSAKKAQLLMKMQCNAYQMRSSWNLYSDSHLKR